MKLKNNAFETTDLNRKKMKLSGADNKFNE